MYENLNAYIARLEREGELVRIGARVDPVLEMAEITDRISKSPGGGRALLFENTGTEFPVLMNAMGSDRRMALALGAERLEELTERIDGLLKRLTQPADGRCWPRCRAGCPGTVRDAGPARRSCGAGTRWTWGAFPC